MKRMWILVYVYRGFIQEPEIFFDKLLGERRLKQIRNDVNPDYDEVGLFEMKFRQS